ncbi:MAG TPA: MFS transporter [Burkholderiales bacterium]|nr:MFS transporter [Burkholderiales bacterium]
MDLLRLLCTATLRSFATGMGAVLLGIYLAQRGVSLAQIGIVLSAGLAGGFAAMLLVSLRADRWGRRRILVALSLLGATGGVLLALADTLPLALAAAVLGMVNGTGRDRGAASVLEQAILPQFTGDRQRTMGFARYNLLQSLGQAFGALAAGLPILLQNSLGLDVVASMQAAFLFYSVLLGATCLLYLGLSPAVETPPRAVAPTVSPETRRTLRRISGLFAIDSIAGGFLGSALIAYFFFERFGVGAGTIGALFFLAGLLNAVSHLVAAWLAARIGLVNTMVFTHIPSSLILVAVGFAPSFAIAAALYLLREALVEMDVPTRQSYVMAVVRPEERTFASGVTNLVRLGGWAVSPSIAGLLMQGLSLATPLFVGASLKIGYDLLLYAAFRKLKPPEERQETS